MTYTLAELVIFAGSLVAILASVYNIVTGGTETGLHISYLVILMVSIVIVWTLKKNKTG